MRFVLGLGILAIVQGCASQSVTIRSLPPEHPAAENAAAVESAAAFAAATKANEAETEANAAETKSNAAGTEANGTETKANETDTKANGTETKGSPAASETARASSGAPETLPPVTPEDAPSMYTYDPWERVNRFTYRFNARFDEAVFLRAANAYRRVPSPIRSGVHNFFGNLSEVDSVINYALQWRLTLAARSLGRFVINSTIGIGGLFDTAAKLKLPGAPTGLSATLAKWGMHPGPYLVIPLLGPSTLRDGLGFIGDYGTSYGINIAGLYRGNVSWALGTVNAVDQRANVNFRYYSTGSPFEYENIRFLYVRKRLIEDEGLRAKLSGRRAKSTTQQENAVGEPAGE
jgi:phospholipid-binding lipoprotein MlaA